MSLPEWPLNDLAVISHFFRHPSNQLFRWRSCYSRFHCISVCYITYIAGKVASDTEIRARRPDSDTGSPGRQTRSKTPPIKIQTIVQGVPPARGPGLGWLWFGCSTILPSFPATSAKIPSAQNQAGSGTHKIQVNPTQSTSRWDTLYFTTSLPSTPPLQRLWSSTRAAMVPALESAPKSFFWLFFLEI